MSSEIRNRPRLGDATHYSVTFQNIVRQPACLTYPNTSKIFMRALLAYFFINVRRNDLENIFLIEV